MQLLRLISTQAGSERLVVIDGSTTYHASLLQKAKEWNNESAFKAESICDFAERHPTQTGTLQERLAQVTEIHSVTHISVGEELWQPVNSEEGRQSAERKLDRWLVKPTDGIYARLNRRISIPISRQLIKFPITANMVTIFTLGVGFASGASFALGGYWSTLLGAWLCLWSGILDGRDSALAFARGRSSAPGISGASAGARTSLHQYAPAQP